MCLNLSINLHQILPIKLRPFFEPILQTSTAFVDTKNMKRVPERRISEPL